MTAEQTEITKEQVSVANAAGSSSVVLVCEHASHHIPTEFRGLGLSEADLKSHAAWDPGAMAVAQLMSTRLDAVLVASEVSRLVYDCNRPPDAPDAMTECSETISVPGNRNLTTAKKKARADTYYRPFEAALRKTIRQITSPVIVTIHSFTPVFHGKLRTVEIGILHDSDARLADAMLGTGTAHTTANVQRNAPYGPEHGVTHTLCEHAINAGHLNVMLEIRNDLIATTEQQSTMAGILSRWIADACGTLKVPGDVRCQA
jgi:predicted N-formylglutamate amidohydrolase